MDKKQMSGALVLVVLTVGILFGFSVMGDDALADATKHEVTADGYGGPIHLEVYLQGDEVVDIRVMEQNETEGIGDVAIEEMVAKIMEAQSTEVDVHSGATVSSNAVIAAVNKALGKDSASEDSEEPSASDYQAEGVLAMAPGYGGDIVLDVIMDGDDILDIKVLDHKETEGIGDVAIESMVDKILQAQSADVDVETGATVSSEAVIKAVAEAAGQNVSKSEAPADPAAEYDLETYEPEGVLVSGKGFQDRYDMYLDVIFEGSELVEIRVIQHNETKGFGDGALRVVPERIVNQQTTEVDVQTGATWTSTAIIELVQQAIDEAGIDLTEQEVEEEEGPAPAAGG
ncbi:FMN-binding protein [Tindallia californiensis]|uniref:Uncharacterized protein, contains FMN-binding domain n=1 Tax=Tindallia californiensis TaxID=159292 RepID=A0A1H3LP94_9FIRM|nr:FMN-binding protein [Tindallia californiensis]SDY66136.1 Uncharacterized protein, contains FMN-binding domain [Tindallia californiensis]